MKQERYRYDRKCEKCKGHFQSDKASTMFCSDTCKDKYFKDKYGK